MQWVSLCAWSASCLSQRTTSRGLRVLCAAASCAAPGQIHGGRLECVLFQFQSVLSSSQHFACCPFRRACTLWLDQLGGATSGGRPAPPAAAAPGPARPATASTTVFAVGCGGPTTPSPRRTVAASTRPSTTRAASALAIGVRSSAPTTTVRVTAASWATLAPSLMCRGASEATARHTKVLVWGFSNLRSSLHFCNKGR